MKRLYSFFGIPLLLIALISIAAAQPHGAYAQEAPTPTPTYDPLAEPFLPEDPSEYELGHNWYWHNCMTCHGDVGQGLTDEFRAIWPEEEQNCWAHGCHGGRMDDEGFPIPTVVPPLVEDGKLAQFDSQQAFYDFLKSTHPPQDPGCLEDEQYQAIVKYVFSMNDRPLDNPTPAPTITVSPSNPTSTQIPESSSIESVSSRSYNVLYLGLGILLVAIVLWVLKRKFAQP
ncbi:MAG: hypothetical protein PVJ21_14850 [Anaerolineales bacterium]|jgi:hypothetical protein